MNQLLFSDLPEQINERIYNGSISIDLIRPMQLWADGWPTIWAPR